MRSVSYTHTIYKAAPRAGNECLALIPFHADIVTCLFLSCGPALMRILCVCQKGNMRSVAMAYQLRKRGHDVLTCGAESNTPATLAMLCLWADLVIVMSARFAKTSLFAPAVALGRLLVCEVGTDKWFKGYPDDLSLLCSQFIKEHGL